MRRHMTPRKQTQRPFEDHFSHMESALFRDFERQERDDEEIDALLDQLFPSA